ncbi:LacI family DNA-binding transcriptional regulator [Sphingomonas piscis]|uniref:LacI family DNA-binding transcriptional regulator n=1 Tax=Sphingomonas piscis TaxID=2714943 RepID=A0A6G7YM75_9SPHN|nr:LacI family DNA-binding transcriptional regulator [Sphingomonas piscis]QIK77816.1 LacI family DNA-binding transcriptional regulator [Sphingomonas piscis]
MSEADLPPKLDDVAAKAGVSTATVSRFFNNPNVVAPATAERIRTAVEATGYIPNLMAGGLASAKSRLVAVLIPHIAESIFGDMIERMVEELTASGITVMLGVTGTQAHRTEELIRAAMSRRADAIISTGPVDDKIRALVQRSKIIFIQVWELPADPIDIAVGFSHRDAGRDIARFLISRGYRRPHLVTSDAGRLKARSDAFRTEWSAQAGSTPTESVVDMPSRYGHARRVFAEIKRLSDPPDVVVCGSDHLAQGLIIEAQASGFRVPDQLGIVGFGNASIAGEMRPTITTVDIDGSRIAREAIAALARPRAERSEAERRIDVGFRLIARESA